MDQKTFLNNKPVVHFVSTPIGNLKEISNRTIETFNDADIIACEDTRVTSKLLTFLGIKKELLSCHEHNEKEMSQKILNLISKGKKVCYASDAGYPLISDPGKILLDELIKADVNVSVISGPSAFLNALCLSNLPTNHFYFHGFIDPRPSKAQKELEDLKEKKETLIFYIPVHKLSEQLNLFYKVFGDREASLSRELTKIHEHIIRESLGKLIKEDLDSLKGEFVLVVAGNQTTTVFDDNFIKEELNKLISKGLSPKDSVLEIAEKFKLKKNFVYSILTKK